MNGPVVILLLVLAVVPAFLLVLRLDAWLTERAYRRRNVDESERYQRARAAVARRQASSITRIGHNTQTPKDTP